MAATKRKQRTECILAPDSVLPPDARSWPGIVIEAVEHYEMAHSERVINSPFEGGMRGHYNPEHFLEVWASLVENEQTLRQDVWGWAWAMFKVERRLAIGRDPTATDLRGNDAKAEQRLQRRFREWARARLSWHRLAIRKLFSDGHSEEKARRGRHLVLGCFKEWVRKRTECSTVMLTFYNCHGDPAGCWPHHVGKASWDTAGMTAWGDVLCWLALVQPVAKAKRWTQVEEAEAVLKRFGRQGWTDEDSSYLSNQAPVLPLPEGRKEGFLECLLRHIRPDELKDNADDRLKDGLSDLHRAERAGDWVTQLGKHMRAAGMARKRKAGRKPERRPPRETEWAFDEDSPRGWRVAREITSSLATMPPSQASELLSSVIALFGELQVERISSEEMNRRLKLKPRELANQLKPLGIKPRALWFKHRHLRGYCLSQFKIS